MLAEMAADAHAAPEIIQNIYIPGRRKGTHRVAVMIPSFTGGWGGSGACSADWRAGNAATCNMDFEAAPQNAPQESRFPEQSSLTCLSDSKGEETGRNFGNREAGGKQWRIFMNSFIYKGG